MPFSCLPRVGVNLLISLKGRRARARKQLETVSVPRLEGRELQRSSLCVRPTRRVPWPRSRAASVRAPPPRLRGFPDTVSVLAAATETSWTAEVAFRR